MTVNTASLFSQETAATASSYVRGQGETLNKLASDGDISLRAMALLGGIAMVAISVMGILGRLLTLHFVDAVLDLYTFILGLITILLEGNNSVPIIPKSWEDNLQKYALFLKFVWGRGYLYFVAGTLMVSQFGLIYWITGGFMCFVGITYILVGRRAHRKLKDLRNISISEHDLQGKFRQADEDSVSALTPAQFQAMTLSLGMRLSKSETETLFVTLDPENTGRVSYDSFATWWAMEGGGSG